MCHPNWVTGWMLDVPTSRRTATIAALASVTSLTLGTAIVQGVQAREAVLVAVFVGALAAGVARAPRATCVAVLGLLPFLAGLRRLLAPTSSGLDPIVAIPLVAALLLTFVLFKRQPMATPLSRIMIAYAFLLVVEVANPLQGSLTVGGVGAGLSLTAVLWFYVGRATLDAVWLQKLIRLYIATSLVVAAYGLKQQLWGFSANELTYIASRQHTYAALNLLGYTRPFSTLSSGAEYGHICAIGAVAAYLYLTRWQWRVPSVCLLASAAILSGTRSIVVLLAAGFVVSLWRRRNWSVVWAIPVVLIILAIGSYALRSSPLADAPKRPDYGNAASASLARTVSGLAHPFDRQQSTVTIHAQTLSQGLLVGLSNPLGLGPGAVSLAANISNEPRLVSGESDFTDRLIALGYPGGIFYLTVLFLFIRQGKRGNQNRDSVFTSVMLLVYFNSWFVTGEYAASALFWAVMGARDVMHVPDRDP